MLLMWLQVWLGVDGGGGVVHRIPVGRTNPWAGVFERRSGEKRRVGPHAYGGFSLRYTYEARRFIESGASLVLYQVGVNSHRESFWMAAVPIRWGTQIDTSRWTIWGGLRGALLLSAESSVDVAQVYRFKDYFSRSQLQLQVGAERSFTERWALGMQLSWDITSAWDRVLFQDSRTLPRHLMLGVYGRYFARRL